MHQMWPSKDNLRGIGRENTRIRDKHTITYLLTTYPHANVDRLPLLLYPYAAVSVDAIHDTMTTIVETFPPMRERAAPWIQCNSVRFGSVLRSLPIHYEAAYESTMLRISWYIWKCLWMFMVIKKSLLSWFHDTRHAAPFSSLDLAPNSGLTRHRDRAMTPSGY